MSFKLNHEGILLFEQPFIRVPYENYRKVFRTSQKYVERELGAVQNASNELLKHADATEDNGDMVKSLDAMIARVEGLKKKLSDLHSNAGAPTLKVTKTRLDQLSLVEDMQTQDDPRYPKWADTRLNKWIVDWALRTGRIQTAEKLTQSQDLYSLVDLELFAEIHRIEDALRKQSCTEALAWCNENKNALKKIKSTLEFELRLQEFIELARCMNHTEAIAYLKKHLAPWKETHLEQIQKCSALLAVLPTTTCGPYKRLYSPKRWESIVQSFRQAVYTLNTLSSEPLLHLALYAGLASLKLPICYEDGCKNVDCPVCDHEGLGELAKEVPQSHHVNSTIVCRYSSKIMDEDNPPMAFPNGFVYSRQALEDMAQKNNGRVKCMRSGAEIPFTELKKVYIS
ncbi:hypothetical protein SISNIDRAFT_491234 [Sistotremastrum niveocremeum HHB9708]|uniref:Macrophage erythroblast attacher n=1 Tax=Sistotremastrum niveocremeum HHB9708 TaxID=1314777 RepID=A0A164N236_9AGAM|nr:hypothetical protein SISNIDRAFT_491234 [Sistotremastrum niveocremeum HHB9708]